MTDLLLYPRVAPANRIRLWLGVVGRGAGGQVRWKLDGKPVAAAELRPFQPAHRFQASCHTGVFELEEAVRPGRHQVQVDVDGCGTASIDARPLPDEVPEDDWLRILLLSCYHRPQDQGHLTRVVQGLPASQRPHFTLLMGDQVYLDMPTFQNFPDDEAWLARRFEDQYRQNWSHHRGLRAVLALAPSLSVPDDHEYWNNFPHPATVVQNSWTPDGRKRWRQAADAVYDAFQVPAPAVRGEPVEVEIPPLSILALDQRSLRREDARSALTESALDRVDSWVDHLIRRRLYGAVVTGQPLLDLPAKPWEEKFVDRTLPNYGDYRRLVRALLRLSDAGRPVLLLTGDVHWGRVSRIRERIRDRFIEFICSPASLVSTVGADQLKTLGAALAPLFGRGPIRWPRHADPLTPPEYFAAEALSPRKLLSSQEGGLKGDQIALLCVRRAAGTLEAKIIYHELHPSPRPPTPFGPWRLREEPSLES